MLTRVLIVWFIGTALLLIPTWLGEGFPFQSATERRHFSGEPVYIGTEAEPRQRAQSEALDKVHWEIDPVGMALNVAFAVTVGAGAALSGVMAMRRRPCGNDYMKKRHTILLRITAGITAGVVVCLTPLWHFVPGILYNEAFFAGRPTNYWRHQLLSVKFPHTLSATLGIYSGAPECREAREAGRVLEEGGERALPVLRDLLADRDMEIREQAAQVLASMGDGTAAAAVPSLYAVLREDPEAEVRTWASIALMRAAASVAEAAEALRAALSDKDEVVRSAAIAQFLECLNRFGAARGAEQAVPVLRDALNERAPENRRAAVECLGRFAPQSEAARASLQAALSDEGRPVRAAAAEILWRQNKNSANGRRGTRQVVAREGDGWFDPRESGRGTGNSRP